MTSVRASTETTVGGTAAVVSGRLYGYGLDDRGLRVIGVSAADHAGGGGGGGDGGGGDGGGGDDGGGSGGGGGGGGGWCRGVGERFRRRLHR